MVGGGDCSKYVAQEVGFRILPFSVNKHLKTTFGLRTWFVQFYYTHFYQY